MTILRDKNVDALEAWSADAIGSDMASFANGIRQDIDAVRHAMILPWSNGQVEGQIQRLKLLKRQMYGRAKLDLLRARLVRAARSAPTLRESPTWSPDRRPHMTPRSRDVAGG